MEIDVDVRGRSHRWIPDTDAHVGVEERKRWAEDGKR